MSLFPIITSDKNYHLSLYVKFKKSEYRVPLKERIQNNVRFAASPSKLTPLLSDTGFRSDKNSVISWKNLLRNRDSM